MRVCVRACVCLAGCVVYVGGCGVKCNVYLWCVSTHTHTTYVFSLLLDGRTGGDDLVSNGDNLVS